MTELEGISNAWKDYFFSLALAASSRSTCDRLAVGCVLVKDKSVISTGYNGALRKAKHCLDTGHLIIDGHCQRVVHAETNAITSASRMGINTSGCYAFITHAPCLTCFKHLISAGCICIYYMKEYKSETLFDYVLTEPIFAINREECKIWII